MNGATRVMMMTNDRMLCAERYEQRRSYQA